PYRADHVGSLLRPDPGKKARAGHFTAGTVSAAELAEVEDRAIAEALRMQESVGLKGVTDGEIRRTFWHLDFMDGLTGLDMVKGPEEKAVQFHGTRIPAVVPTITQRLDFPADHPMIGHFKDLAKVAGATPK